MEKVTSLRFRLSSLIGLPALLAIMASSPALAQTNPTPRVVPFTEDFGGAHFSAWPSGFQGWDGLNAAVVTSQAAAEATVPSTDAAISSGRPNTPGGFYGYGASASGSAGLVQKVTPDGAGVSQLVLAIDSSCQQNLVLSYKVFVQSPEDQPWGMVTQYRVGTSGSWTTIAGSSHTQANGSLGDLVIDASLPLPAAVNNKPIVQIRWAVWRQTGAFTGNPQFVFDDIEVSSAACTAPSLTCPPDAIVECDPSDLFALPGSLLGTAVGGVEITYNTGFPEHPLNQAYLKTQLSHTSTNGAHLTFNNSLLPPYNIPGLSWATLFGQVSSSQFGFDMVLPAPTNIGSPLPPFLDAFDNVNNNCVDATATPGFIWAINDYNASGGPTASSCVINSLFRSAGLSPTAVTVTKNILTVSGTVYTVEVGGILESDDFIHWFNPATPHSPVANFLLNGKIYFNGTLTYDSQGDPGNDGDFYGGTFTFGFNSPYVGGNDVGIPSVSDACDPLPVISFTDSTAAGSCPQNKVITRTWKATNSCGLETECVQTVTVVDTTPPRLTGELPGGSGIDACMSGAPAAPAVGTIAALYTDACGTVIATQIDSSVTGTNCSWTATYTYTVEDECSNFASNAIVTYTGGDGTGPVLSGSLPGGNNPNTCLANAPAAPSSATIEAEYTDNCGGMVSALLIDTDTTGNDCAWTRTYTYSIVDDCGNPGLNAVVTYTGGDTFAPVLTGTLPGGAVGSVCQAGAPAAPAEASIAAEYLDNCSSAIATLLSTVPTGDDCAWSVTYTYSIIDSCGNAASNAVVTYTGGDTTPPNIGAPGADVTIDCPAVPSFTAPTASDNCDANPSVVQVGSDIVVPGTCAGTYTVTRTWKAVDACLNESGTVSQTITVQDITAPVVSDCPPNDVVVTHTGTCTATATWTEPSALDACGGTSVVKSHTPGVSVFGVGTTSVTYTFSDGCGNSSQCQFDVVVGSNGSPTDTYVDDDYVGLPLGTLVNWPHDGNAGPYSIGCDAFATVQGGINGVATSGTVHVAAGTYAEDVALNKLGVSVLGSGVIHSILEGPAGGDGATVRITGNDTTLSGFQITRFGNNPTNWNDANLNFAGIAIQGQAVSNATIHDNLIVGNRSGLDINNSNGHTIRNNVITNNHTGMIFRNQTDDMVLEENEIIDNRTVGILFLDASGGSNVPVQTAANWICINNHITQNWYGQIVDRQTGGSLPVPGTTNLKNFSGNWFGTTSPIITTANSAEPGYASLIPVVFGGTATPPGGQPDIAGAASDNFDITPMLTSGSDTNVETTPGRGTYGFQGDFSNLTVTEVIAQAGSVGRIQEGIDLVNGSTVNVLAGTYIEQVDVDKSVILVGANAGIDPRNGGARGPESIVLSDVSDPDPFASPYPVLFYISTTLPVTIDGFLLDGDNPALTSGELLNGADLDAEEAIASYEGASDILIQNNIIRNFSYTGIDFYNYYNGAVATSNNVIKHNLIENLGAFGWGLGVLIYNNFYADIIENEIFDVRVGIQTGNFHNANPGSTGSIADNDISARRLGVFYNLHYSNASHFDVVNNIIEGADDSTAPLNARWSGMLISSQQTAVTADFIDNVIDGSAILTIPTVSGYTVWNTPTTGDINIIGGSVNGVDYGVWVNNFEGYNSNANDTQVTVDNVDIDASDIGVWVYDSPSNTNGASVFALVTNDSDITGSTEGITVAGVDASAKIIDNVASITGNDVGLRVDGGTAFVQNNNLSGNSEAGIRVANNGLVDAGQDCLGSDITGLGGGTGSTGGNNLSGYGADSAAPWAIENQNGSSDNDVFAHNNNFGTPNPSLVITGNGGANSDVLYSTSGGPQTASCPGVSTVECSAIPPAAVDYAGFVAQGGSASFTVTSVSAAADQIVSGTVPCGYAIDRVYTLSDGGCNSIQCTQTINVQDTTPPSITSFPSNGTGQCIADIPAADTNLVTAVDLCGLVTITHQGDSNNGGAGCVGDPYILTRTYRATDSCGNFVDQDQTFTIEDTTAPVIASCPSNINDTVLPGECRMDVTWPAAAANDNCLGAVTIVYDIDLFDSGPVETSNQVATTYSFPIGVHRVTAKATDSCGNTNATCSFLVTVNANGAPAYVYVDDDYLGLPDGTFVNFPDDGNEGPYTIGCNAFAGAQAAADAVAVGGTVEFAPGTFLSSSPVLTISTANTTWLGANAGNDARSVCDTDGARGAESILDAGGTDVTIVIIAGGVTIDGFTITGGFGGGIYYAGQDGNIIRNNIITGNTTGIFPYGNNTLIQHNRFASNNLTGAPASGPAIYVDGNTLNLQILENEFVDHTTPGGGFPVILESTGAETHTGVTLSGNRFAGNWSGPYFRNTLDSTFSNNTFTDFTALGFVGGCDNIEVVNNFFIGDGGVSQAFRGIRLQDLGTGPNSDIRVNGNSFTGFDVGDYAVGIPSVGDYTGTLDASANWWDDNTAAAVSAVLNATGGPIDYTPWLDVATDLNADPCNGFQGDFSYLHVDDDSPQASLVGRIQEGVNRLADGTLTGSARIVDLKEGSYPELATLNKSLKLHGPNMGTHGTAGRVAESTLDATGLGSALVISADDVTVDGVNVSGQSGGFPGTAIWMQSGTSGTTVRNSIIENNIVGIFVANDSALDQTVIERNLFQNNTNPGAASGHSIYGDQFTAGVGMQNVLIDDNTFTNTALVVGSWAFGSSNTDVTPFTDITFSNNTVENHGRGMYFFNTDDSDITGNTIEETTNYAIGLFGDFGSNDNILVSSNHLEGNFRGVWVYDSSVTIEDNNTSIIDGDYGIIAEGPDAKVLIQNNVLTGNSVAAIYVLDGATVDAGSNCNYTNYTGLGTSAGGNDLSGYTPGGPWAIENLNASADPDVLAFNNNFGAYNANPGNVISGNRGSNSFVLYSISGGPQTVSCPADLTGIDSLQCGSLVPAAAANYADFQAQGGFASFSVVSVTANDQVTSGTAPCNYTITRTYTLSDGCANYECEQLIHVEDTTPPVISDCGLDQTSTQCAAAMPDMTGDVVATDNCGSTVVVTQSPLAGTYMASGTHLVTITVTDVCGNFSTCQKNFTVDASNCSPVLALTQVGGSSCMQNDDEFDIVLSMADLNRFEAYGFQSFQHFDNSVLELVSGSYYLPDPFGQVILPINIVASNASGDIDLAANVDFGNSQNPTSGDWDLAVLRFKVIGDSCTIAPLVFRPDSFGQITRITGFGGVAIPNLAKNNAAAVQLDSTVPTATQGTIASCYPTVGDANAAALAATTDLDDNCDPLNVGNTVTKTVHVSATESCSTNITIRVADTCGNFTDYVYNTRVDNTPPVVVQAPNAADATLECSDSGGISTALAFIPDFTDNCTVPVSAVLASDDTTPDGTCANAYVRVRTWTATDECGNVSAAYTQTITVIDTTAPVATAGTISTCYPTVAAAEAAALAASSVVDNCTATPTPHVSTVGDCSAVVSVWYDDGCGNTSNVLNYATRIDDVPPVFVPACPLPDINVNSDAGGCDASASTVNAVAPAANDICSGALVAVGSRSDFLSMSDPYPQGLTVITWTATDECGNASTCQQDVNVSGNNQILVDVDLPGVDAAQRCVTFEIHVCGGPPLIIQQMVALTGGSGSTTLLMPCTVDPVCITARDTLHSLRRTVTPTISLGNYVAEFTTSALTPLTGGNLNDDEVIDILDFGVFISQYTLALPASDCTTSAPHSDISGDGTVFAEDYGFISLNFLDTRDANCCSLPGFAGGPQPVTRISVEELWNRGLGQLTAGDLNEDGWLDELDMAAFAAGVQATPLAVFEGDGNWFDSDRWGSGSVPNAQTNVVLPKGARATINRSNAVAKNITLRASSELILIENAFLATDTLTVKAGALLALNGVNVTLSVRNLILEAGASLSWSGGTIQIDGGSFTQADIDLVVGDTSSLSTLQLVNGSITVITQDTYIGNDLGDRGRVEVIASTFNTQMLTVGMGGFGWLHANYSGVVNCSDLTVGMLPGAQGDLFIGQGSIVRVTNGVDVGSLGGLGDITLAGGELAATTTFIGEHGHISGHGKISGWVENEGLLQPHALLIAGHYVQSTTGTLAVQIGGMATPLTVKGSAQFDGELIVAVAPNASLAIGQMFEVVRTNAMSQSLSQFTAVQLPVLEDGMALELVYTLTGVQVRVIEQAPSIGLAE